MKKLLTIVAIFLIAACKKEATPACQKWETKRTCESKSPLTACANPVEWQTESICGEMLRHASPGNEYVYMENEDVKMTITFIRKAE